MNVISIETTRTTEFVPCNLVVQPDPADATTRSYPSVVEHVTDGLGIRPGTNSEGMFTGRWTVAHVGSGYTLTGMTACLTCVRLAARVLVLADPDIDWTRDRDDLVADEHVKATVKRYGDELMYGANRRSLACGCDA